MPKITLYKIKGTTEWKIFGIAAAIRLATTGQKFSTRTL
jgi:hypothetical protein